MTNQEQEQLLKTESLVEDTLNYIQYLVSNNCSKEIKIIVKENIKTINFLLKQIAQDKFKYIILRLQNLFFISSENLKQDIETATRSIEFEKKYLLKIKELLKKDEDYNNLGLIFSLIYSLGIMKNIRNERIDNVRKTIQNSIKGIEFIPDIKAQNTDELQHTIEEQVQNIKKEKIL